MLSRETEARVVKILLEIGEGERTIETSRQILSEIPEYDPFTIFRALDKNSKNKLDYNDINNFLHTKGIYASEKEIKLFFLFYDEDSDGFLSYYEFLNFVQSHNFKSRINAFSNNEKVPFNVEYSFSKLLEKELSLSRLILPYLEDLKFRFDFSIHGIYDIMKGKKYIDEDSIQKFLDKNSVSYVKDDIILIKKRLDFNNDGRIDLSEFHLFFGFPGCVKCCPLKVCCCNCPCLLCCPKIINPIYNNNNNNTIDDNNIVNNENENIKLNTLNNNNIIDGKDFKNSEGNVNTQDSTYYKTIENNYTMTNNDHQQNNQMNNIGEINQNNNENNNPFYKNITSNLILRFSPERKFSPNFCRICRCDPCICISNLANKLNNNRIILNDTKSIYNTTESDYNSKYEYNKLYGKNSNEENQLNEFLKELMEVEKNNEKLKIDIALKSDFNIEEAFSIFESGNKSYLIDKDLKSGLNLLGIFANESHIRLLMKRFDLGKKSFLNFSDFFDMIVPFEKDYRNMVEKRYPNDNNSYKNPEVFMEETRIVLNILFTNLIETEIKLNNMKKEFSTLRIKLRDIFGIIDQDYKGFFTKENLDTYLKHNCIFTNIKDSDLLFIRLDKNRDGKIDLDEFLYELQPQYL